MKLNSYYWENRYQSNETGWDTGEITTPLKEYIDQLDDLSLEILIPGAGNSYEFEYLVSKGFTNVSVLDFAETPLQNIWKRVPNAKPEQIIHADFFEHYETYDLILEQPFLCALTPDLRKNYAEKMYSLLKPKGKIIGLLFQFPLTEVGPPFGGSKEEYEKLFSPLFHILKLETAYNSIKPRQGNELFFIFEKK